MVSLSRLNFDPTQSPAQVAPHAQIVPAQRLNAHFLRARFHTPPAWEIEPIDEFKLNADKPFRPAAVLIPLVMRAQGLQVLFTQRTAHLHDHAGQISFPGGRRDETDADNIATALRETEEETGIVRTHIEVIGCLPDYLTGTGYRVAQIVGLVQPDYVAQPDPFEVAEVFEVPLAFLMDGHHHQQRAVTLPNGMTRLFYAMPYPLTHPVPPPLTDSLANSDERFIWGATAGMLRNFYHFLRA